MRCSTPAMMRSNGVAMLQNRMQCAAIESSTCSIFWSRSQPFAIARATRWDAAHRSAMVCSERAAMPKNRTDVLRLKVQHAQYFDPTFGIFQLFMHAVCCTVMGV